MCFRTASPLILVGLAIFVFVIFIDSFLPTGGKTIFFTKMGDCIIDDVIIELSTLGIAVIVRSTGWINAKVSGSFNGVDVGSKENEFPSILVFLTFDFVLYLFSCVTMTCIFHSVSRNDKQRMFRTIFSKKHISDINKATMLKVVQ